MTRRTVVAVLVLSSFISSIASARTDSPGAVRSLLETRQERVVVQQWDLSCGAAALATILKYQYGEPVGERDIALELIRRPEYMKNPELVTVRQGFSLLDLQRVVERRQYQGVGLARLSVEDLIERAPVIVPVNLKGYNHFVVFRGVYRGRVLLADPAWGNRIMPLAQFEQAWIQYPRIGKIGFVVTPRGEAAPRNRLAPRPQDFLSGPEDDEGLLVSRERREAPIILTNLALDVSVGAHMPVQPRVTNVARPVDAGRSATATVSRSPGVSVSPSPGVSLSPSAITLSPAPRAGTPVAAGGTMSLSAQLPVASSGGTSGAANVASGVTSVSAAVPTSSGAVSGSAGASSLPSGSVASSASQPVLARASSPGASLPVAAPSPGVAASASTAPTSRSSATGAMTSPQQVTTQSSTGVNAPAASPSRTAAPDVSANASHDTRTSTRVATSPQSGASSNGSSITTVRTENPPTRDDGARSPQVAAQSSTSFSVTASPSRATSAEANTSSDTRARASVASNVAHASLSAAQTSSPSAIVPAAATSRAPARTLSRKPG